MPKKTSGMRRSLTGEKLVYRLMMLAASIIKRGVALQRYFAIAQTFKSGIVALIMPGEDAGLHPEA